MADVVAAPKRHGWLRKLGWAVLVLLVLLLILYFVATSSAFFKGVILPRVSKALDANVTVADASIHPFSGVVLRQVTVQTTGPEPLLKADEVRLAYHLWDIIGGNYNVDEVAVVSPAVEIIQNPDGTSNLDRLIKPKKPAGPGQLAQPSKPSAPLKIDIKKITVSNAAFTLIKNYKSGNRDVSLISSVNVNLSNLKNGQTGKLDLAGNIKLNQNPPAPGTNASLQAKLAGNFTLGLSPDLKPTVVNGNTRIDVQNAGGALADLASLAVALDCDVTPTEVKQVALRFQQSGNNLGEVLVSGPFDAEKTEGRLQIQVRSIDRRLLSLAGAKSGIDFGTTTINSTNQVELTKAGLLINVAGQLNVANMKLTRQNQTTPTLDIGLGYQVALNQANKTALLQTFNLNGVENQQPFLRGELTSPMSLAWGNTTNAIGDSALKLAITHLNLADWGAFLNGAASSGMVNLTLNLLSQQAGKQLVFDLSSQIDDLAAKIGANQIRQATVTLQAKGQAADLNQFNLSEYRLQVAQQNQPMLTVSGSSQCDVKGQQADLQVTLDATLARLFGALSQPDISASAGTVELKAHLVQKQETRSVTGNLVLVGLTGQFGSLQFTGFGVNADLDLGIKNQQAQIRKVSGTIQQSGNAGGSFEVSGDYDLDKKAGQLALKLADLNQNGLRPFLASALGDKQLVSVTVNATGAAKYDAQGGSSLQTDFQLANLVVRDPKNQLPASPLEAKLKIDASFNRNIADVRQFQVNLTPTERATNELRFNGQVDMSQTNAIQGSLKLAADSLDVTHYYDIFSGKSKAAAASKPAPVSTPEPAPAPAVAANTEPAAVNLPFRNFNLDMNIGRLYLREVAVTNWQTSLKIDGGHMVMNPFQLTLNNAPVKASVDLNLGVPGYQYDVTFSADKIPLAPLADSFSPDYNGKAQGDLIASAQIKGAGITGTSLQKNLTGQVSVVFTNGNIQLVGPKAKTWVTLVITPIALALRLGELTQSPINWVVAAAKIGSGNIELTQVKAVGSAFAASSQGTITIANVLTNSAINNLPVDLALSVSLAQKANLASANANANSGYADLGRIATVSGTIGNPKTKVDYARIALLTGKSIEGIPGVVGGKAGQIIKGVEGLGGLLGGQGQNAANTNLPPATTNAPAKSNSLGGFLNRLLPK